MMVACERMYVRAREREKVCVCDAAAAATKLEEQSFNLAASEEIKRKAKNRQMAVIWAVALVATAAAEHSVHSTGGSFATLFANDK